MIFIYIYDALMVPNAAWSNFLIDGLDFSDWMIGLVTIAGATFAWLGTSAIRREQIFIRTESYYHVQTKT
jgi:hypothetical protein